MNWRFLEYGGLIVLAVALSNPLISSISPPAASASSRLTLSPPSVHLTFWLRGSYLQNWNQTNPGPLIVVTDGDTVTILYNSIDSAPHTWFIDVNGNNVPDNGEISSMTMASSVTFVNFTFTLKVGTNIPSTGDFTYKCSVHATMMVGTFRVLAATVPNFTITANPTTIGPINTRTVGTSIITVASTNGFSGTVTLSASPSSGLNASILPTSIPGSSGTATLSVNSTVAGSYSVTVTGAGSPGSHSATITVTVVSPDFKIALSSSSLTVAPGSSGTVMVTLTSLNGFSGTVSLASSLSSQGPQVTFSPTSVTLSSTGPTSSTLSVSAASSGAYSTPVPEGNYSVNVTGTSGSLAHSAILALTVGSSSGAGVLPTPAIIAAGIASAIAIVAATVYFLRRRPRTKT